MKELLAFSIVVLFLGTICLPSITYSLPDTDDPGSAPKVGPVLAPMKSRSTYKKSEKKAIEKKDESENAEKAKKTKLKGVEKAVPVEK